MSLRENVRYLHLWLKRKTDLKKYSHPENGINVYDMPLGVTKIDEDVYCFLVSAPDEKNCTLSLFDKTGKCVLKTDMDAHANGIFSCLTYGDFYSYAYRGDSGEIRDPYAKSILNRECFGKRTGKNVKFKKALEHSHKEEILPEMSFGEEIFYKLHVRGFTRDESACVKHPGTFLGVTEKIRHMKKLGATSVVLMPVYDFDECSGENNINFWGYGARDTYYMAPKASYAFDKENPEKEFEFLVSELHKNNIKVFLEFLFDETAGYSFIQDTLRYWVSAYGIDGFKLDSGNVPVKEILSDLKLFNTKFIISNYNVTDAENYKTRVFSFNRDFETDMRRFIKGDEGMIPALFEYMKKRDIRSGIKYITDNNGFTLYDLYSYDIKHNEENKEYSDSGEDFNYSWNCGAEGETKNARINALRLKMKKNLLLTLFLSGGAQLIYAGDETGNSQKGNNNSWCLDGETGWVNWNKPESNEIFKFIKELISLKRENKIFSESKNLSETDFKGAGLPQISFHGMTPWKLDLKPYVRTCGIYFCADDMSKIYVIFNMHWENHTFKLPLKSGETFKIILSTDKGVVLKGDEIDVTGRTVVVLKNGGNDE